MTSTRISPTQLIKERLADPWKGLAWAAPAEMSIPQPPAITESAPIDNVAHAADISQLVHLLFPLAIVRILTTEQAPATGSMFAKWVRLDRTARRLVPPLWRDCLDLVTKPADLHMQISLRLASQGTSWPLLHRYNQIQPFAGIPRPSKPERLQ